MTDLTDATKALENDAQHLRDNLPNLSDPPTADELKLVEIPHFSPSAPWLTPRGRQGQAFGARRTSAILFNSARP